MNVTINYQPSEMTATLYWFNAVNNRRGSLVWECEHQIVEKSAVQNYMTFDGVDEYEETWNECVNCERQWDLSGAEL